MPDGFRTDIACRAYVIGRRPQMPTVKQILQHLESRKQLSGRRTLQNLYGIGYSQRRRDGYEQMDMIRLDFQCQDLLAILRTPYHMVCRLVHTIAVVYDFYQVSNFITW